MMNILVMLQTVPSYFAKHRTGQEHHPNFHFGDSYTDKTSVNTMDIFYTDIAGSYTDTGFHIKTFLKCLKLGENAFLWKLEKCYRRLNITDLINIWTILILLYINSIPRGPEK